MQNYVVHVTALTSQILDSEVKELITVRRCGWFLRKVWFVGRPDDVASIWVRRDEFSSIATERQTFQLLQ